MFHFISQLWQTKCPPLVINEINLEDKPEIKDKLEFEEADVRPNFAKELLEKGYVEFPVFRKVVMMPLGFQAKFCNYEVVYFGPGLCKVIQTYGKQGRNSQDHRYLKIEADSLVTKEFYFYYNRAEGRYKQLNMEHWLELIEQANQQKRDPEVIKMILRFYRFYNEFWIHHVDFINQRKLEENPSNLDFLDYIYYLTCEIEYIGGYLQILNIFGELDDEEYRIAMDSLELLEKEMDRANKHLHSRGIEEPYDAADDLLNGRNIQRLEECLKWILKPGYHIDPFAERAFPNIGEVYKRIQPTKSFANHLTIRERNEKWIQKAKKVFTLKERTEIKFIKDYGFIFVD